MKRWIIVGLLFTFAFLLGSCNTFVTPTKVVFASNRTGFSHIYIMTIGGTGLKQLTFGSFEDLDPAFSPTGDRIAFVSNRGGTGNLELFTMNADGTNLIQRTSDNGDETDPSWSYDGRRIAFCFSVGGGNRQIWVYDTLTSNFTQITNIGDNQNPSFHPNGQWIIFGSNRNGGIYNIFRASANFLESNVVQLTFHAADAGDPSYSPNGSKVCFVSYLSGTAQVYRMDASGANQVQVTSNLNENFDPHYTPDSSSIVWTVRNFGIGEIYRMRDDGTDVVNLTQHAANDERPTAARTSY